MKVILRYALLSILVLAVKGWKNPNLKYFGFYTYNNSDYEDMPYANLYENTDLEVLVAAYSKGLQGLWFIQAIFFDSSFHLRPDYLESWQNATEQVAPLIKNETVLGFMMGDELINNGVTWDDLDLSISLVRKTFPDSIIYTNEAFVTFTNDEYYPRVPEGLDWVSIDYYPVWGTFEELKTIYFDMIYPKMSEHQRVMYVPGIYSTVVNPAYYCGNVHCEEVMIAWNLQAFQWAQTDSRFVGIFPWHFDTFTSTFLPGFEIGLENLPQLTQAITNIGTQIITGEPTPNSPPLSGGICGLSQGASTSTSNSTCGGIAPNENCPQGFVKQTWVISSTPVIYMYFCASSDSIDLPSGGICGINTGGDMIPCNGFDPLTACPQGYFQQIWESVAWGTNKMYFCEKTNGTLPDATGTLCGMVTNDGATGVKCGDQSPNESCPGGYASASWLVPFGNSLWSVCFKI